MADGAITQESRAPLGGDHVTGGQHALFGLALKGTSINPVQSSGVLMGQVKMVRIEPKRMSDAKQPV